MYEGPKKKKIAIRKERIEHYAMKCHIKPTPGGTSLKELGKWQTISSVRETLSPHVRANIFTANLLLLEAPSHPHLLIHISTTVITHNQNLWQNVASASHISLTKIYSSYVKITSQFMINFHQKLCTRTGRVRREYMIIYFYSSFGEIFACI